MFDRLRSDLQLAIITICGTVAVAGLLPFAIYRLALGQILVGIVELLLIACIVAATAHALRGHARAAGIVLAVLCTAGLIVVMGQIEHSGPYWVYPVLVINYFIAPRRLAIAATLLLVAAALLYARLFATTIETATFVVTALMVALFAHVIAARTEAQRGILESIATHDELTGAGNRRLLQAELAHAMQQFDRGRACHGIALLDLDRFKQVNDCHGHEVGDAVLRSFSQIVRESVRKSDRFYRYGGEEFVLLLPVTDNAGLAGALAKVQAQIRARLHSPAGPQTVSIGAALPQHGEHWTAWLARADAALYRAKRTGRDRIVIDGMADGDDGTFDNRAPRAGARA